MPLCQLNIKDIHLIKLCKKSNEYYYKGFCKAATFLGNGNYRKEKKVTWVETMLTEVFSII